MARTSVSTTVQRIRRQLAANYRWEYNALALAVDADDTSVELSLAHNNSVRTGSILNIGTELMRVTSASPSSNVVEVARGWLDSTAVAHTVADEVLVNPRFTTQDIFEAMIDEIDSWSPNLFRVITVEQDVSASQETIELPVSLANTLGLVSVQAIATDLAGARYSWPAIEVRLHRHSTVWSDATSSGILMRLITPIASGTIVHTSRLPFDTSLVTMTNDLVTDVGLSTTMLDVLSLGVRLRLAAEDEMSRLQQHMQDQPQRSADRPAGVGVQPWQALRQMYTERKTQERIRLNTLYPIAFQP
jgi:hypothetical protein